MFDWGNRFDGKKKFIFPIKNYLGRVKIETKIKSDHLLVQLDFVQELWERLQDLWLWEYLDVLHDHKSEKQVDIPQLCPQSSCLSFGEEGLRVFQRKERQRNEVHLRQKRNEREKYIKSYVYEITIIGVEIHFEDSALKKNFLLPNVVSSIVCRFTHYNSCKLPVQSNVWSWYLQPSMVCISDFLLFNSFSFLFYAWLFYMEKRLHCPYLKTSFFQI